MLQGDDKGIILRSFQDAIDEVLKENQITAPGFDIVAGNILYAELKKSMKEVMKEKIGRSLASQESLTHPSTQWSTQSQLTTGLESIPESFLTREQLEEMTVKGLKDLCKKYSVFYWSEEEYSL